MRSLGVDRIIARSNLRIVADANLLVQADDAFVDANGVLVATTIFLRLNSNQRKEATVRMAAVAWNVGLRVSLSEYSK
jgi:hypothetical protein